MLLCDFCAIIYNNNNNDNRDSTFLSIFALPNNAVCWITFTLIRFNFTKKEKRDLGPVVTCCNPLNQDEHPA